MVEIKKIIKNGETILSAGTPNWEVVDVEPKEDYILLVTFVTGEKKLYDCKPLLKYPVFERVKNPGFFKQARVSGDTVIWNDELDVAPEDLYEKGVPV